MYSKFEVIQFSISKMPRYTFVLKPVDRFALQKCAITMEPDIFRERLFDIGFQDRDAVYRVPFSFCVTACGSQRSEQTPIPAPMRT